MRVAATSGKVAVLDEQVEQEHLGRVGLDPAPRERLALLLEVDDARHVDARVGVQGPAGLDLQRHAGERHAPGEPGSQPARERLDDLLDGRRQEGRGIAAGHPAVGVARRGVAAPEIELARLPAAPRLRELGNGLAGAERVLAPRLGVAAVTAEVRHEPEHVELGCRERVPAGRDQLVGRDAGLVLLRGLVDGCLREVGPLLQREVARSHAEAHLRRAPELTSDGAHELDLADAVERDARADADRLGEQRPRLARAVDGDQLRRHPAGERGVQLGRPEDVAAEALLREHAAHGERVVGLDRGQHARRALRPRGRQGAREAARVATQVILGDDRERRAEALGQAGHVAALDLQPPVDDREALVDLGGDGHQATLRDLLPGSFAALTHRWSDGLIGQNDDGRNHR